MSANGDRPENRTPKRVQEDGAPLLSFQVITDTHVTSDPNHVYNRNLERALRDIADNAPASRGIMHAGDVTDHGFPDEYAEFRRIREGFKGRLPEIRFTTGNHDVGSGVWEERLARFLEAAGASAASREARDLGIIDEKAELRRVWDDFKGRLAEIRLAMGSYDVEPGVWEERLARYLEATGTSSAYHDAWIGGYHFIFLGTEEADDLFCSLSARQLDWLDAKLGEDASPEKPAFVFLHQPLKNTVAGSAEAQGWYGVMQDEELKAVLSRHRQAILFTGHTHWELGAANTFRAADERLPAMLNAASVAYLWTDDDERKEGSQGYYVDVYPGSVLVRGRDFASGTWVEGATFRIEYPVE
ncbi:metallophosphoesterase family protein [Cohnella algarum]|uniref:metallophosphoesterase family protein n=1 Tax=Cohnella algarum TaxID=2044859 RepID=UPI001967E1A9|nr:metallophosphoesterase [Cohnella algarum]MBN2982458.1 metallophosphoesterase [Cohnella algarum]